MNTCGKRTAVISALIFVIAAGVILLTVLNPFKSRKITDFETVTVRESGMRSSVEYEIVRDGEEAVVSLYTILYNSEADERRLEKSAVVSAPEVIDKLTEVGLLAWDGFHGAHPRNVSDGTMFTLDAVVNGGKRIHADGSENFPRHYREFIRWIMDKLN